jgi:spore coat protein CotF
MEVHEILNEQMNTINHFTLYARQAQDPLVRDLVQCHLQACIQHYDQLVAYTHDYNAANQLGPSIGQMPNVQPNQIVYGLDNPARIAPLMQGGFNDHQILSAMLICHKNSAKNCMNASLECADPNVRQMLVNGAVTASNLAYEAFLLMNRTGQYQVPTMHDHTAKTYLHSYLPMQ